MKKHFLWMAALLAIFTQVQADDVAWFDGQKAVSYYVQGKSSPVVTTAINLFSGDMEMVTGRKPVASAKGTIRICQLDKNAGQVGKLRKAGVPVDKIKGQLDAYWMGVSDGQILIVGANGRGCAYGLLELSRQAGVSPWVWWSDVVPAKKSRLTISDKYQSLQIPSVSYRGIFLNDEDWTLQPWAWRFYDPQEVKGRISAKAYKRLFELLLRLRANAIWPGMHGITKAFYTVPGAMEAADSCGIVIGTSHCEPMMRNNVGEWRRAERGEYNYLTNKEGVQKYWIERLKEAGMNENFYTVGMRGIHDGGMEGVGSDPDNKTRWLQKVIDDQRELLKKYVNKDLTKIPQQFVPYKEVLAVMENGLNVPDDVMLTWCDDNFGYMTRLSDKEQQKRSGGAGVYHHLSYWGAPHDYMWLCTTQPGLVYNEMMEAYNHNARRLWVTNIHEPKVAAYPLELFLDIAWDVNSVKPATLNSHLEQWLCREFGEQAGKKLLPAMLMFYHLTSVRRPEFMGWNKLSAKGEWGRDGIPAKTTEFSFSEFGNEANRYMADWQQACRQVEEAEKLIPERLKDAFFSHIKYQVLAASAQAQKLLEADRARSLARRNYDASRWTRDSALYVACAKSQAAHQRIRQLTDYWNNEMAGGRWKHTMCWNPRDLTVFYAPRLPELLTDKEVAEYSKAPLVAPKAIDRLKDKDTFVARNAAQWDKADDGAQIVQMLGHSMQAVSLPKGKALTYSFRTESDGECVLRTAVIPTQPNTKDGDVRYGVTIDGGEEKVISFRVKYRSSEWDRNVLRGQAVANTPVKLSKGNHTLVIRALDDHVVIDQWMVDYKPEREFYLFPVTYKP